MRWLSEVRLEQDEPGAAQEAMGQRAGAGMGRELPPLRAGQREFEVAGAAHTHRACPEGALRALQY